MRIAFLSEHRHDDVLAFSGVPLFMARALQATAGQFVHTAVPAFDLDDLLGGCASVPRCLREIGAVASEAVRRVEPDLVVCQGSSMVPYLESAAPVVLWHDSTWRTLLQMPGDAFVARYPQLHDWDQRVLDVADAVAFAARWVLDDTRASYNVAGTHLCETPWGPSLPEPLELDIEQVIAARDSEACHLLFLGVDHERKGLALAYALLDALLAAGRPAVLDVIGVLDTLDDATRGWSPRRPFLQGSLLEARLRADPAVRLHGFLAKDDPQGRRRLAGVLAASHFLVHPATFEPFGVALVEAAAFGVPVLALDRQGPASIVVHGETGWLLEQDDFVPRAAALVAERMERPDRYTVEARAAHRRYRERLTWSGCAEALLAELRLRGLVPAA